MWLSHLYASGYSIESLSEPLWWEFDRLWNISGSKAACVVPMHSLLGALIELFMECDRNPQAGAPDSNRVQAAVRKSAFSHFVATAQ